MPSRSILGTDAESIRRGLPARSIVVLDEEGTVLHTELVEDVPQEPNDAVAVGALG